MPLPPFDWPNTGILNITLPEATITLQSHDLAAPPDDLVLEKDIQLAVQGRV